jgi:hypothetical protein
LKNTSSIEYDQSCIYYFVPTCIRDCLVGTTIARHDQSPHNDLVVSFSSFGDDSAAETTSRAEKTTVHNDGSNDDESEFGKSRQREWNKKKRISFEANESVYDDVSILDSQSDENLIYVLEDSVCGMAHCRY